MQLTAEQNDIIQSTGNIKINAVAGSGKTTTIIEYAKARPASAKILYLAFNKSVKLEAVKKFADKGLNNVNIETAHSLAYKHIVWQHGFKVRPYGYKTYEIAELLNLQNHGEKYAEYIIANHINKFITYFCNSSEQKVRNLNYPDTISEPKAKSFVHKLYGYIEQQTRLLLAKMDRGEIEVTHDFYLKKFQLSNPTLHYDYILFDEGQDASAAMLDIFVKQKATKVIVGDTHQQIYGWRFAVNSLKKVDFKTYKLSTSFRFSQDIANLAKEVLRWKKHISEAPHILIKGKGTSNKIKSKVVLARTNLGLLLKAIEYVIEKEKEGIYFEGNINSYTYADEGTSLYDVLNLYNNQRYRIRDKLIKNMKNLEELEDYIEKTEDVQLGMMVEIVKKYRNEIPGIIKEIKEKHIENDDKKNAEMIFSTVHRCKGMEYDAVQIADDFICEDRLKKLKKEQQEKSSDAEQLNEEINLLYVAVTRTKNHLFIPDTFISDDFPQSSHIHVIKGLKEDEKEGSSTLREPKVYRREKKKNYNWKAQDYIEARKKHEHAYKPWTKELEEELTAMYHKGADARYLAKHFGRSKGAIRRRVKKLELRGR
jgi:superfamily I DNA/RNA helicase